MVSPTPTYIITITTTSTLILLLLLIIILIIINVSVSYMKASSPEGAQKHLCAAAPRAAARIVQRIPRII